MDVKDKPIVSRVDVLRYCIIWILSIGAVCALIEISRNRFSRYATPATVWDIIQDAIVVIFSVAIIAIFVRMEWRGPERKRRGSNG